MFLHYIYVNPWTLQGHTFTQGGQRITVFGGVICAIGDVPASNFIGGFKGVGFSLRKCRKCLATKTDTNLKVTTL